MPKLNVDEVKQLGEPIEVTLEGKTYIIDKVTTDLMDKVVAIKGKTETSVDAPIRQLALLLGIEPKVLKDIDIRKIGRALKFITESIEEGLGKTKN